MPSTYCARSWRAICFALVTQDRQMASGITYLAPRSMCCHLVNLMVWSWSHGTSIMKILKP